MVASTKNNIACAEDTKTSELGRIKLESSGLTLEDAKLLRIECLSGQETKQLHRAFKPLSSLKLNYLGPDHATLSDWPCSPPFYRIRYLETANDFSALTDKKSARYTQEPNTAPVAYFPGNQDWSLIEDVDQPLIITEGELKAAKACKEGFPTVGLGGVYNWRAKKLGITFLPSLELVKWHKRYVYICFDSDYRTNTQVCNALHELAQELHNYGSFVHLVSLPQLQEHEKVGLDDFLVHAGPSSAEMFGKLLSEAEPLGLTAPLWHLNKKYVYVRNPGIVMSQDNTTDARYTPAAFKEHLEAPLQYQERRLTKTGDVSYAPVPAATAWLKWPLRTEVECVTYAPGKEMLIQTPKPMFNTWSGWGVEPLAGDVSMFLELIDHIFQGAEPEAKQWFLRWCAYPLQYPGTKLYSAAVVHGQGQGTGKSTIGKTLARIYGRENYSDIAHKDLHSEFNEWSRGKQLIVVEETGGDAEKRKDAELLRRVITRDVVTINIKNIRTYSVPDCMNYYFSMNNADGMYLADDDRRYFIHEVHCAPLTKEFSLEYNFWLFTGGASAIFDYLLNLDLGDFSPTDHAFRTAAKERMIDTVRSDLAGWVRDLVATPDYMLRVGDISIPKDLFTSKELLQLYDPLGNTRVTANGVGRELTRAKVRQVCNGAPIRLSDGSQARFFALRNVAKWLVATQSEIVGHLEAREKTQKLAKY